MYGLFLFIVIILAAPLSAAPSIEQHQSLKKTGSELIYFSRQLEQGNDLKLTTALGKKRDVTRMNINFTTQFRTIDDPIAGNNMSVFRKDNELSIDGVFKGEKIKRTIMIDTPTPAELNGARQQVQ